MTLDDPPAPPTVARPDDEEHLRLLAVFHYVVAAFTALFSLLPVFHLVIGLGILTGTGPFGGGEIDSDARWFGGFFVVFAGAIILAGLAFAASLAFAGHFLAQQRHYMFCLVMAGLACALFPFGTALGVFTLLVLLRPSVKERFGAGAAA